VFPQYNWTIEAGRIIEGQRTSSIKVDTIGIGRSYTATVRVSGFDERCSTTASCSLIQDPPPPSVLFDRYYPKSDFAIAAKKLRTRRRTMRRH
jgi:hypothetical protein